MDAKNPQHKNQVDICMISDNNYVMPTCVTIQSLLLSKSEESLYCIYIIASNLSGQAEDQFKSLATDSAQIHIIRENAEERFVGFHRFDEKAICAASISALLKFLIPELLPCLDKVLYLDGDLIVRESLEPLFNENINRFYAAAVRDSGCMFYHHTYTKLVKFYFNSGVMLLNLKKIRSDGITQKLIETKRNMADSSPMDQDVFNLVFDGHLKLLPIRYNFQPVNLYRADEKWKIEDVNRLYGTDYRNKKQLFAEAAILHYSSKDKPWKEPDGPCASEWLEVYFKTPIEHTSPFPPPPRGRGIGISVIMPCYNVENYVGQTLDSLIGQTFQNFEILCLDDGSTDATLAILREYERSYTNIRVFANSNHGQGWERNYGLRLAQGKYIYFMDSDDLLRPSCLNRVYTYAEVNQLDLLFFEANSFYESEDLARRFSQYKTAYDRNEAFPSVYTGEELYIRFREKGGLIVSPCLQLAKKQFLEENHIAFREMSMMEDNLFVFDELRYARRVKCIPDVLYDRRIRENSTMTADRKADKVRALSLIVSTMMQTLTDYKEESPMFCAVAAHIGKVYLPYLHRAYNDMLDSGDTGINLERAQKEVVGFSLFSEFEKQFCISQAQNSCQDILNSKTYLVGRIITWLPKQIVAFIHTVQRNGMGAALQKAWNKLALLSGRAVEAFRK